MNLLNEEFQKEHQMKWGALNQFKRYYENKFNLWEKLFEPSFQEHALWFEINTKIQNISLHYVNLENKDFLNTTLYDAKKTIVMTSATLSINGSLEYFKKQLKIERETIQAILPTPFHYKEQCRMMVVKNMAQPLGGDSQDSAYFKESLSFIKQIIETSEGGVLILCTSFLQLNYLEKNLKDLGERYPLFIQNTKTASLLLKEFQENQKGVLIGVDSFWEGIDVVGPSLKTVIIMKLPFKPPTNPISQTLYEIAQKEGKNAFITVSVPEAVIRFKQGFGRLIRSRKDKGCVICLDNRLISKAYGKEFISSLPTRTYYLEKDDILKTIKEFS
jgi:ATP-dependent DNA helicase DinG